MIHIRYTYSSSQSSTLLNHHKQLLLLYNTMTAKIPTSPGPIVLWPWVNVKVIKTGIKLQSLIVFSIIPHLKKNQFKVFPTQDDIKCTFYKAMSAEYSPLNNTCAKEMQVESQQTNKMWQQAEFHPNPLQISKKMDTEVFFMFIQLWPWKKAFVIQTHQNLEFSGLYHLTKFPRNCTVNVWTQANVEVLWMKSQK